MNLANLLAFDLAVLFAVISPGPAFLIAAQSALRYGRRAGLLVALGLAFGGCTWMLLAFLGLSALFAIAPWSYVALKIIGAAYLCFIAYKLWKHSAEPIEVTTELPKSRFFRSGLWTNLSNPKAPLFVAAIYTSFVPAGAGFREGVIFISNQFAIETGWYSLVAILLASKAARDQYMRAKIYFDRICASGLGVLGIRFLWSARG